MKKQKSLKFIHEQLIQIQRSGWVGMARKAKSTIIKITKKAPQFLGLYLFYYFAYYLTKTLFSPHPRVFLGRFHEQLRWLINNQLKFQSDTRNSRLISINLLLDKDLPASSSAYLEFVSNNPNNAEGYFQAASALYLQGKYIKAIDEYYAKGLEILSNSAKNSGLNLLSTRFICEEWTNIGHLSCLDSLIKLQKLDLLSPEKRVVYMREKSVSNSCYLNYWSEHINIFYLDDEKYYFLRGYAKDIIEHLSCWKLRQGFTNLYSAWNLAESSWQDRQLPPLLRLKDSDRERGLDIFEKLSIPTDAWFIAIHVREGDTRLTRSNSNAKIETYLKAIQTITDRGGWVIRMGHPAMTPLPKMERVVDYANSEFKSDWMDVFLWASCRFFVGTSSGPLTVPPTFGRPILYTNCPAIGINPYLPKSLMLPKLYYSNTENRFFSFREMLESSMGWTVSSVFEGIDCIIVENTAEEIEAGVIEMLEMEETNEPLVLSGLQNQFNQLRNDYGDTGQITISQSFIKNHSGLLL